MNPNMEGRWFRSESFVYGLSNSYSVKTDFLAQARNMAAPEVADIVFAFTGTVGAVTGGALGRDAAKLYEQIRFTDEEEVLSCSGAGLRVLEQIEFGQKTQDPADITSGSTNAAYRHLLKVTFEPLRAERPRDTRIPLAHFLEGGELIVNTPSALPTGWNTVQADQRLRVFVRVVDGRTTELKSRYVIREQTMTNSEFDYEVSGSLRLAVLTSKLATTGYSSQASQSTIFSRTLELPPTFETALLRDRYLRYSDAIDFTNDEVARATPGAIALIQPNRFQKIGEMIDTKTLHIDLGQAPVTGAKLITGAIKNRTPNLAALVSGYGSVGDMQMAMRARGRVVDSKPGGTPVGEYNANLVRRLPVRIG